MRAVLMNLTGQCRSDTITKLMTNPEIPVFTKRLKERLVDVYYRGRGDHGFVCKVEELLGAGKIVRINLTNIHTMHWQAIDVPCEEFPFGLPAEDAYYSDGEPTQSLAEVIRIFYADDDNVHIRH